MIVPLKSIDSSAFKIPPSLLGPFAVVKPFPNIQAAEDENIARLQNTAKQLGLTCLQITPDGEIIEGGGKKVSNSNCDFVINLHFDKPKNYDVFSFVALWNPLTFYHDFGYNRVSRHLLSHDDFLSCSSMWADDHVSRMLSGRSTHLPPKFKLYHSLSRPIFSPAPREYHLFYAGINWERLGKGRSRHQELLDLLDKSGKLRIYGPDVFQGVRVWDGYQSYQKQIPFDGVSMVKEIAQCGAALVLSSDAHKQSELMSNRLFESLAAGALVICDENPFARRNFGETLLYINSNRSAREQFEAISEHLKWAKENPSEAAVLASAAQRIFLSNFSLDLNLSAIYNGLVDRKAQIRSCLMPAVSEAPTVRVILIADHVNASELERRISSIANQTYKKVLLSVVIREGISDTQKLVINSTLRAHGLNCDFVKIDGAANNDKSLGSLLMNCLDAGISEDYMLLLPPHERMLSNHLEVLVGSALRAPDRSVYATASILCTRSGEQELFDYCEKIEFDENSNHLFVSSRFLINTRKIRPDVALALPYLDELMIGALIQDPVTVEALATTQRDVSAARLPVYSFDQQHSVLAEYSPWLFRKHEVTGYSIPVVPSRTKEVQPSAMFFSKLSKNNKIELLASLLEAALPSFIIKPLFWMYDKLNGRGWTSR